MKGKTLSLATLLIVLLAGIWLWLQNTPDAAVTAASGETLLLPSLQGRIGEVTRLEIKSPGEAELQLSGSGGQWKIPLPAPYAALSYPAAPSSVGSLLRSLGEAKKVEAKTARQEQHARLHLAAQGEGEATRLRLHLRGALALELLLGKSAQGGQFVRLKDDNQVWLIDRPIALPADNFLGWINRRISSVPLEQIAKIELHFLPGTGNANAGKTFSLWRENAAQTDFQVKPLAAAQKTPPPAVQNAAARIARLFGALNLAEVRPLAALPKASSALLSFKLTGFAGEDLSGLLSCEKPQQGQDAPCWLSLSGAQSRVPDAWLPAGSQWLWRLDAVAATTLSEALPKALQEKP